MGFSQDQPLFLGENMELSVKDLLSIRQMPNENELTLQTIALFYEEYLCKKLFVYELRHRKNVLKVSFKPGNLYHLLGIHKIKNCRAEKAFDALKDGSITFESLKRINLGAYKDNLYRILYFPFIYQLLLDPTIVLYNQHPSPTMIDAEFLLYNHYDKRYVHLGVKQDKSGLCYYPVTFGEARKSKGANKTHIEIVNKYIEEM